MNTASRPDLPSVCIAGIGVALPRALVTSESLDLAHGLPAGTIARASGVDTRYLLEEGETQPQLGARAAHAALAHAGVEASAVDLVLFAAAVGYQPIPATAPLIKQVMGMEANTCPAWDVNATCLSALVAMDQAAAQIATGRARTVLVVSAEIASRALPWNTDPGTAGLFGDGAAALVMRAGSPGEGRCWGRFAMETWAEGFDLCTLRSGGTGIDYHRDPAAFDAGSRFAMDGQGLYRLSARRAPAFIDQVLAGAGWRHHDVDLVVPHQASPHALAHLSRRCGFVPDQVLDLVAVQGNQVAASLPISLHHAVATGRLRPGMKALMVGTSAGVSIAAATLEW